MMSLQQNRVKNTFANELNDKAETAVIRTKEATIQCMIVFKKTVMEDPREKPSL